MSGGVQLTLPEFSFRAKKPFCLFVKFNSLTR